MRDKRIRSQLAGLVEFRTSFGVFLLLDQSGSNQQGNLRICGKGFFQCAIDLDRVIHATLAAISLGQQKPGGNEL